MLLTALLLTALLLAGCDAGPEEGPSVFPPDSFGVRVELNGEPWPGEPPRTVPQAALRKYSDQGQDFVVRSFVYDSLSTYEAHLSINFPLAGPGRYVLSNERQSDNHLYLSHVLEWGSSGLVAHFPRFVSGAPRWVEVTAYDAAERIVEGRFELTLVVAERGGVSGGRLPDTLRFTDGRFRVRAVDYYSP